MRILVALYLALALMAPGISRADVRDDPLAYPLKQYGFILAIALFGGLVSWYAKVRNGQAQAWNIMQLTGELCTSAFAGLLAFWLCQYWGMPGPLEAALVGVAGHMGTRAITAFEDFAQRKWGSYKGDDK